MPIWRGSMAGQGWGVSGKNSHVVPAKQSASRTHNHRRVFCESWSGDLAQQ
jgi:hypothetical protein